MVLLLQEIGLVGAGIAAIAGSLATALPAAVLYQPADQK